MDLRTLDRQAPGAGGRFVPRPSEPPEKLPEALLALTDGSIWRGRSVGTPAVVAGPVSIVGEVVVVKGREVGLLRDVETAALARHLAAASATGGGTARGCLTAAGATLPHHAAVALAVARGEIGQP